VAGGPNECENCLDIELDVHVSGVFLLCGLLLRLRLGLMSYKKFAGPVNIVIRAITVEKCLFSFYFKNIPKLPGLLSPSRVRRLDDIQRQKKLNSARVALN
jgi:hypothetical protein